MGVISSNSAFGLTITQQEGNLIVENPYYKAVIFPDSGARIMSLISKETGNEFAGGYGIAEAYGNASSYPGELGRVRYSYKILEQSSDLLKVQFTYHGKTGDLINWSMSYQKTIIFSEETPLIKVEFSLKNIGPPVRIPMFGIHNGVVVGKQIDENDTYFLPAAEGMREITCKAGTYFISNFTLGLAGIIDKKSKDALLFFPDYDSIKKFYFWVGENERGATIEWFYRPFTLERGATWRSSYSILPITLSNISNLQSSLREYGIKLNPSLKVKKAQRPMNMLPGKVEVPKKENILHFNQLVASPFISGMSTTTGKIENNVRLDNKVYSRSLFTEAGAGYEVTLPDAKDIVIEAEAALKASTEKTEICLACCDLVGNLYSVSEPLTLSFWKKSGLVRLPVSELSGKKIRILLYGPGVNWTRLSIVCSEVYSVMVN